MRKIQCILLIFVAFFMFNGCSKFDLLVSQNEEANEKWSNYKAELQRRYDSTENLVQIVKASAAHEHTTLKDVTEARASAAQIKLTSEDLTDPDKVAAFEKAQQQLKEQLKGSLSRLMVVQEQYPDLKANQAFHDLQIQLEATENRILRARQTYNQAAKNYNITLQEIGGRVVNNATGHEFKPRVYFEADPIVETSPKVKF